MHVSDILLECSKECARLSRECHDEQTAAALVKISARLLSTAIRNAALVMDDDTTTTSQSDLLVDFPSGA